MGHILHKFQTYSQPYAVILKLHLLVTVHQLQTLMLMSSSTCYSEVHLQAEENRQNSCRYSYNGHSSESSSLFPRAQRLPPNYQGHTFQRPAIQTHTMSEQERTTAGASLKSKKCNIQYLQKQNFFISVPFWMNEGKG